MNKDFLDILRALSATGANFLVVGAYAVTAYAEPRATGDIDLWVEPSQENAVHVYEALRIFGAPLESIQLEELARPGIIFQMGVAPVRIDILTAIDGVDFHEAWAARSSLFVDTESFPLIGRDHLIMNKRATGRTKDILDLELLEKHKPGKV